MFNKFAIKVTHITGSIYGFMVSVALVVGWLLSGAKISYNDFITMLTFIVLFVIQYSQNKDTAAIHAKLDELIRSSNARNEIAGIEERKSVKEIKEMRESTDVVEHRITGENLHLILNRGRR